MNAQKRSRCIALLFLWRYLGGLLFNVKPRPLYPREADQVPIVQVAGWAPSGLDSWKFAATEIPSPDVQPVASYCTDWAIRIHRILLQSYCGRRCIDAVLNLQFCLLFQLLGLGILAIGVWAWTEKDTFNNLSRLTNIALDPAFILILIGKLPIFMWGFTVCGEYKLVQLIVNNTQWNTSYCYLLKITVCKELHVSAHESHHQAYKYGTSKTKKVQRQAHHLPQHDLWHPSWLLPLDRPPPPSHSWPLSATLCSDFHMPHHNASDQGEFLVLLTLRLPD